MDEAELVLSRHLPLGVSEVHQVFQPERYSVTFTGRRCKQLIHSPPGLRHKSPKNGSNVTSQWFECVSCPYFLSYFGM